MPELGSEEARAAEGERAARAALEAIDRRVRERVATHRLTDELTEADGRAGDGRAGDGRAKAQLPGLDEAAGAPALAALERHVAAWRGLVPESAHARAWLGRLLADRHPEGLPAATATREALGSDDDRVHRAYRSAFGEPLGRVLDRPAHPVARARLGLTAIGRRWDALPPVLLTALLVTGICLPQAILGLPIAAAAIGPLPAVAVLALFGALMTLAMAAETEAIARSGAFRRGGAFLGRLSDHFLGTRASALATVVAAVRTALSVLGGYIGLSVTLGALTGTPRPLWSTLTLLALAVLLLRGGLRISVDVGAAVGLASTILIVAMAAVALGHAEMASLERSDVPLLGGDGPAAETLGPIVGLVLIYFVGNVYVVQVARRVLPRDPTGGALVRGTALGTAALTVLGAAWLLPVAAAVSPAALAAEQGTALGPLADATGPAIAVLGTLTTLLLLGLGIERASLALLRIVNERLPTAPAGGVSGGGVSPTSARTRGPFGVSGRAILCALPALGVCGVGEVLIGLGVASFTDVMSLSGVLSNVIVSGVVPLLLVVYARRAGDATPGATVGVLGGRAAAATAICFYTAVLVAFATVLYDAPVERLAAAAAAVLLVAVVVLTLRRPPAAAPALGGR